MKRSPVNLTQRDLALVDQIRDHLSAARGTCPCNRDIVIEALTWFARELNGGNITQQQLLGNVIAQLGASGN